MDYGKIRELNAMLLEKYNKNEEELKFYDHYLYHMTAMTLSLFRETQLNDFRVSISQAFLLRSIIEDMSVIKKYESNELPENCDYLLMGYQYICEYQLYKNYEILDEFIDLDGMSKNYVYAKEEYRNIIDNKIKNKEFKKIIKSNLPFLQDINTFDHLIRDYYGKYYNIYKELSLIIHPSDIVVNYCELNIEKYKNYFEDIYTDIENEINKYYSIINTESFNSWHEEHDYICGIDNEAILLETISLQRGYLSSISYKIHKDLKINDSDILYSEIVFMRLADEVESINYDLVFGFSDIVKAKIKPIFEFMAVFYNIISCYPSFKDKLSYLMEMYTKLNKLKIDIKLIDNDIVNFYNEYKKILFDNIKYEVFVENLLTKPMPIILGYSSIKEYVFIMIDELIEDETFKTSIKMLYEESQLLSHGNGYALTSNYGSFMDSESAIKTIDIIIGLLIEKYIELLKQLKESNSKYKGKLKKLDYDLTKLSNQYKKSLVDKEKIRIILKPLERKIQ